MPVSVTMPRLGESVTEGTVTRWLKQVGDTVEADEPLLEVSTDKVDTEIPSPASGVLSKIVVNEDETAEVGSELAVISDSADAPSDEPSGQSDQARAEQPAEPEQATPQPAGDQAAQDGRAEPDAAGEQAPAQTAQAPTEATDTAPAGDSTVVKMPALGESVTEGTVTRWLKQVGDTVEADEPLLEVSTDKVDTEIPAPASGTLLEIKVNEDETVAVGADLAVIGGGGGGSAAPQQGAPAEAAPERAEQGQRAEREQPAEQDAAATEAPSTEREEPVRQPAEQDAAAAEAPSTEREEPVRQPAAQAAPRQAAQPARAAAPSRAQAAASSDGGEVGYVTPLVRKLAAEHGVDLAGLSGTGVGGRIRKQDVLEAAERAKAATAQPEPRPQAAPSGARTPVEPSPLRGRTEKMSRMRSLIASRMVESLQTSAQLTTVVEVDVTRIARLRDRAKAEFQRRHGAKLSFLPFLALATVEALRAHPKVNASIDMDAKTVTYHDAEHLGIAVDTDRGLMVPVIRDAGDLNLPGLAKRIADLAERTRTNKVTPDELSGGTFTLTNTGSRGALFDTPIINQPQVGILGTGTVVKRAAVIDDPDLGEAIVPRSMMYLALSYDHRLVDGADAARFLTTIKDRLEGGAFEAEVGLG